MHRCRFCRPRPPCGLTQWLLSNARPTFNYINNNNSSSNINSSDNSRNSSNDSNSSDNSSNTAVERCAADVVQRVRSHLTCKVYA